MICPKCGGKIQVIDTRHDSIENETYRKKECLHCQHVIYTIEFEMDSKDVNKTWSSLDRRYRKSRRARKKKPYECFGRYSSGSSSCAKCHWTDECKAQ